MRHTIFDTPFVSSFCKLISWISLKCAGWRLEGHRPTVRKYVLIAAPHTSNWDFILVIAMAFCYQLKIFWVGKDTLFKGPAGYIMRWLGGIPVDRSKSIGLVQQLADQYNECSELVVVIPPEGSRSKVIKWKSGFYHIATEAGVPIAMGFLDFKRKIGGFGPMLIPTGNVEKDLEKIKKFYSEVTGKKPQQFT